MIKTNGVGEVRDEGILNGVLTPKSPGAEHRPARGGTHGMGDEPRPWPMVTHNVTDSCLYVVYVVSCLCFADNDSPRVAPLPNSALCQ